MGFGSKKTFNRFVRATIGTALLEASMIITIFVPGHPFKPFLVSSGSKMSRATQFVGTADLPQTVCPSLKGRLTLDVTARVTRIGRAEPQNKEGESWTSIAGLSSESIRQSCAMPLRSRRMVVAGTFAISARSNTTEAATRKLVTKLAAKYRQLTFCYEAGPTGYRLYIG